MDTFQNFNTNDVNPNSNDINFQFEYNELNGIFMDTPRQQNVSGKNTSRTDGYQPIPNFTLSSNMLPTPNGSDHNACSESMIMSPYSMLPNSVEGTFREDEVDPYSYLSSPLISPILQPDQPMTRQHDQKSSSTYNQMPNNPHYSPLNKPEGVNNSVIQLPGNNSSPDNNSIENNSSTKNNVNKLPTIMTGSPSIMPNVNMPLTSSIAMQEPIPNLNLGSNLVSEVTQTQPSSAHLSNGSSSSFNGNIVPITPSSLMKLNKQQSSTPNPTLNSIQDNQTVNTQQGQIQNQQTFNNETEQPTFVAPRSRVTTSGPQRMLVISPTVSPISPRMNPVTMSPMILPSSGRKIVHTNQAVRSPSTLNPSKSPQTLKLTISPSLKPKLPGVLANEVAEKLASQSNYKNILEGTSKSLGISYSSEVHSSLESRRTTHKAAEQKRRDSLKQSFDELKKVVPLHSITSNNTKGNNIKGNNHKNGSGNDRNITKGKSCDGNGSLKNLHQQTKEKDELIQKLTNELDELKAAKKLKIEHDQKNDDTEIITDDRH
ncbi:19149_t:CDS:2 [Racocetra persica]|uniref:19149_t:CDS:1 n=1 Tax=Racocetra persica TaxID=160502 RepID=A0ACA9LAD2_9GLOM|nr:19149_t:CDS:2 [Racocetra persica]